MQAYALNGTPADCVKLGLEVICKERPDFVFSGMNVGPNLGRDLYYSGTMAGASEAVLHQIPAISVSLDRNEEPIQYAYPKELLYDLLEGLFQRKWGKGLNANVNLPYLQKKMVKGIAVVPMDMTIDRYHYVGLNDPHGNVYYWLKDHWNQLEDTVLADDSDYAKLREGYITVTPIDQQRSNRKVMERLERLLVNKPDYIGGLTQ